MNSNNLYPELQKLSRKDKLKVMQFLIIELAKEEEIQLQPNAIYSIVFPCSSHEAVRKLGALLEENEK